MIWLLETLLWTGALIALVLLVRRPVARHFGAQAAYALWALPLLRLMLPPIVLPACLVPWAGPPALPLDQSRIELGAVALAPAEPLPRAALAADDLWALLAAVWLAGAAAYIVLRLAAYRRLRRELLAAARPVGVAGKVRLVETPATRSPLAFGVRDKVVALPPGFMAQADRAARDLALAHELAHHRAHDLAANFAMLPLFAVHWFNPLSRLGWSAMRRDQEAACDARVVEGRARADRARYAALIAGAAAAPRFALAAPMACPVLGDNSILHRLRTLAMTDHSPRRRRAGRALVRLAALALPLTASFSYAQSRVDVREPPTPAAAPLAPPAPLPPAPPEAPPAPQADERAGTAPTDAPEGRAREVVVIRKRERREDEGAADSEDKVVRHLIVRGKDGKPVGPGSAEFEAQMRALEERLGKLDRVPPERVFLDHARLAQMAPIVVTDCEGSGEGVSETRSDDGRRVIRICQKKIAGHALGGLRAARAAIARNGEMSAQARATVLAELDREIARIEAED